MPLPTRAKLKALTEWASAEPSMLLPAVEEWHRQAVVEKSLDQTWEQFQTAWRLSRLAAGANPLAVAYERDAGQAQPRPKHWSYIPASQPCNC